MPGFYDVGLDGLEEFEWFPENLDEAHTDYESLTDLREEALHGPEDGWERECGDIEEDGLMWKYSEGLVAAADNVFGAVCEKLCGYGLPACGGVISQYAEQLGRHCELVQSSLFHLNGGPYPEAVARIQACLSEKGCVVAMIEDGQWRRLTGEPELPFWDSGIRTVQVIGIQGEQIIVSDFANALGSRFQVPIKVFCTLDGILMEVYK